MLTEKTFRLMGTGRKVDAVQFIKQHMSDFVKPEIYVGTDSQNFDGKTTFVSTILFRYPGNGARVIYTKEKVIKIHDLWTRLWSELERSIAIAQHIQDELGFQVKQIDMDYNSDDEFQSHKVYKAAKGYVESLGFRAKAKPELLMATWAANSLCA